MKTSSNGIDLIKIFERLVLKAYVWPAGVLTIGYGHTGKDVKVGQFITKQKAEELLQQDLIKFENAIADNVIVSITQNHLDALVSFVFNIGIAAFQRSTLLKLLNEGEYFLAADQFPRWNKANNEVLPGLVRRRSAERQLFLSF